MKKLSIIAAFIAVTFAATSCTKDNVSPTAKRSATTLAAAPDKNDVGTNQMPPP